MKFMLFVISCLAVLCTVAMAQNYAPEQIRLELTGTDNEINVIYTTGASSNSNYKVYTSVPQSTVFYGTSPDNLSASTTGVSKHYTHQQYRADIHVVTLKNLKPYTLYYYRVGDTQFSSQNGISDIFHFTSGHPNTWCVFGDYGLINMDQSWQNLLADAKSGLEFGGVLFLGDIAYDLNHQRGNKGDIFLRTLQPLTANYPTMTIVGNHEHYDNFTHWENRFGVSLQSLGDKSGSDTPFWFSWDAPNVHFLAFDTEVYNYSYSPGQVQRQLNWLKKDLEYANQPEQRKKHPWIITLGHKCDWQDLVDFTEFLELFHNYGVDLHLCGHQHNYQRLYPGYKSLAVENKNSEVYVDPNYWTQIVIGSPGCQEKISSGKAPYKNGVAARFLSYGYGALTVTNSTHLTWTWKQTNTPSSSALGENAFDQAYLALIHNQQVDDNTIKDKVTIIQHVHGKRKPISKAHQLLAKQQLLSAEHIDEEAYVANYFARASDKTVEN